MKIHLLTSKEPLIDRAFLSADCGATIDHAAVSADVDGDLQEVSVRQLVTCKKCLNAKKYEYAIWESKVSE